MTGNLYNVVFYDRLGGRLEDFHVLAETYGEAVNTVLEHCDVSHSIEMVVTVNEGILLPKGLLVSRAPQEADSNKPSPHLKSELSSRVGVNREDTFIIEMRDLLTRTQEEFSQWLASLGVNIQDTIYASPYNVLVELAVPDLV